MKVLNFIKKLSYTLLILFCLLNLAVANADSTVSNLDVEELLNSLSVAGSKGEATALREKIWKFWLLDHSSHTAVEKFEVALSLFKTSKLREADRMFSEIITLYPNYMEAWNKRATIRYMNGDFYGSLRDIEEVLRRQERHFGALAGSGLIFMALGENLRALEYFSRVLEIDPWNEEASRLIFQIKNNSNGTIL